jgi:hypothetical protein
LNGTLINLLAAVLVGALALGVFGTLLLAPLAAN